MQTKVGFTVLASRASGHHLEIQINTEDNQYLLQRISQNVNVKYIVEFFHFNVIPRALYKDIMYNLISKYMFMIEI